MKFNHIDDATLINLIERIGAFKWKEIERKFFYEDRLRSLFGYLLAIQLINDNTVLIEDRIIISRDIHNKPYLLNNRDIHFNISHSSNWVACAIDGNIIGIDIEVIELIDFEIYKNFFCELEYQFIMKDSFIEQKLINFYKVWTLKESLVKAIGLGLMINLKDFCVIEKIKDRLILKEKCLIMNQNLYIKTFLIESNCVLSIASLEKNISIEKIDFHDFMKNTLKEDKL